MQSIIHEITDQQEKTSKALDSAPHTPRLTNNEDTSVTNTRSNHCLNFYQFIFNSKDINASVSVASTTSAASISVVSTSIADKSSDDEWNQPVVDGWGQSRATTDNAKVRPDDVGSGNLHRQGRNYKPVNVEIVLQCRDKSLPKGERHKGTSKKLPLLEDDIKKSRKTKSVKEYKWGPTKEAKSTPLTKKAESPPLEDDGFQEAFQTIFGK
ncbi:hypothetical protein BC937DRAFT_95544 [Endogone sp. FLAS-F59071]|nr:hypothetical protein BC937DRAFT_95544 [Endogone sp. FLAS-F59071]|eukprot:RUS13294.1 hypothetical protein BC937DRAFT_95544 [Endogone sp. FLAS-F59071]